MVLQSIIRIRSYKSTRQSSEGTDLSGKEYTYNYVYAVNNGNEFYFISDRAERFPASLFKMERANGDVKRTNYYEMLKDLRWNKTLAREVKELKEKVGFERVFSNIFTVVCQTGEIIPYEYKRFYVLIVCTRYLHIIERKSISEAYKQSVRRLDDEINKKQVKSTM